MENLLFYIYHEDLYENEANIVLDLLMAAEKYAIIDLVKICVKMLKESLSIDKAERKERIFQEPNL